jgi:hypothetical protein
MEEHAGGEQCTSSSITLGWLIVVTIGLGLGLGWLVVVTIVSLADTSNHLSQPNDVTHQQPPLSTE